MNGEQLYELEEEFEEPSAEDSKPDEGFESVMETPPKEESTPISAPVESTPLSAPSESQPLSKPEEDDLHRPAEVYFPEREKISKADIAVMLSEQRVSPEAIAADDLSDLVNKASRSPYAQLRVEAALTYMTDPDKGSVRKLHADPRFSHIGESTLMLWCKNDGWVEKRQRFLAYWAANAYKKIGSKLSHERKLDLDILLQARDLAAEKLKDPETKPRSFEGVLTALAKVSERIQAIQESIVEDMMPPDNETESPLMGGEKAQLEAGTMDAMVAELLSQQRDNIREEQGVDVSEADQDAIREQREVEQGSLGTIDVDSTPVQAHFDVSDLTGALADVQDAPQSEAPSIENSIPEPEKGETPDVNVDALSPKIVEE